MDFKLNQTSFQQIVLFLIIAIIIVPIVQSQVEKPVHLFISIEDVISTHQWGKGELSINIDFGSTAMNEIETFEFLIGYDTLFLTNLSAEPGSLIDSGKFEYFNSTRGPLEDCDSSCPQGMLAILGKRDTDDGVSNNYHINTPGELIRIKYRVTLDYNYCDRYLPIRFYWFNCNDNIVLDKDGNRFGYASGVFSFYDYEIIEMDIFGYEGIKAECLDSAAFNHRSLLLKNGYIYHLCCGRPDDRGDVNLNGWPYEMEDIIVFADYLLKGHTAFSINYKGQKVATEVNKDGKVLTIEDLIYMVRRFEGEIPEWRFPFPKPTDTLMGNLHLQHTDSSIIIRSEFEDSIGGMYLTFYAPELRSKDDYKINVFPDIENMNVSHNLHDDTLKILIFQFSDNTTSAAIKCGPVDILEIKYSGPKPQLTHASAAGFLAEYVNLEIF